MPPAKRISDAEVAAAVARLPEWCVVEGALHRELVFADFAEAFAFMTRVAALAEERNHHPEWSNVYDRVTIDLRTHDSDGITQQDFELAAAIEGELAPS